MPKKSTIDKLMKQKNITRTAANNAYRKRANASKEQQEKGIKRKAIYHVGGPKI